MIAVFNHFLSLHGFFLSISFPPSYHLTPSSLCLASFLCFSASVSSCVWRSWRTRCIWMTQKRIVKELKNHDAPNYVQGGLYRFQPSFYSRRHHKDDLCRALRSRPDLDVWQQNSGTSQLSCFIYATKRLLSIWKWLIYHNLRQMIFFSAYILNSP